MFEGKSCKKNFMKHLFFAIIFTNFVLADVAGCMVKQRYTDATCQTKDNVSEFFAYTTCMLELPEEGDEFFRGECSLTDAGAPIESTYRTWERCETSSCDDRIDTLCPTNGRLRNTASFPCEKISSIQDRDVYQKYLCVRCEEMPCNSKFVDGTNINPICNSASPSKSPSTSPQALFPSPSPHALFPSPSPHALFPSKGPISSTSVPVCDIEVMEALTSNLSPACQYSLSAALTGLSTNDQYTEGECECLVGVDTNDFQEWTGVSASSCGVSGTASFTDAQTECSNLYDSTRLSSTSAAPNDDNDSSDSATIIIVVVVCAVAFLCCMMAVFYFLTAQTGGSNKGMQWTPNEPGKRFPNTFESGGGEL